MGFNLLTIGFAQSIKSKLGSGGAFEYYSETVTVASYNATDVKKEILPKEFRLEQNYPNPFNPSTVIRYEIMKREFVSLKIYNSIGQKIATLLKQIQNAGSYDIEFNSSADGLNLPSGIYFYSINTSEYSSVKKMMLVK